MENEIGRGRGERGGDGRNEEQRGSLGRWIVERKKGSLPCRRETAERRFMWLLIESFSLDRAACFLPAREISLRSVFLSLSFSSPCTPFSLFFAAPLLRIHADYPGLTRTGINFRIWSDWKLCLYLWNIFYAILSSNQVDSKIFSQMSVRVEILVLFSTFRFYRF